MTCATMCSELMAQCGDTGIGPPWNYECDCGDCVAGEVCAKYSLGVPEGDLQPMKCAPVTDVCLLGGGDAFLCDDSEVCFQEKCCLPDCLGKKCGGDSCGGVCGECSEGGACSASGECLEGDPCAGINFDGLCVEKTLQQCVDVADDSVPGANPPNCQLISTDCSTSCIQAGHQAGLCSCGQNEEACAPDGYCCWCQCQE